MGKHTFQDEKYSNVLLNVTYAETSSKTNTVETVCAKWILVQDKYRNSHKDVLVHTQDVPSCSINLPVPLEKTHIGLSPLPFLFIGNVIIHTTIYDMFSFK